MQIQKTIMLILVALTLWVGLLSPSPVVQAITIVTPSPDPSQDGQPADEIDIQGLLEQAIEKLEASDYAGAIDDLTTILQTDDTLWDAYFFRAFAYAQMGEIDRALDDYTRALTIVPHDWTTYTLRGDLFLLTEDLAEANLDFNQALFYNPRFTQAFAGKALLSLRQGDQTLGRIFQGMYEALLARSQGESDTAFETLTDVIDEVSAIPVPDELGYVYFNRADIYMTREDWDSALSDINQAIELQPDMQNYYMSRGYLYSETDQPELAAPDFYKRMTMLESTSITEAIDFGDIVPVEMRYGTVARLTFEGQAGQQVTISAQDSQQVRVDPLMVLLDVDGQPIVGSDDSGGQLSALIENFELSADGTYTIMISHANGGFDGTIEVTLR